MIFSCTTDGPTTTSRKYTCLYEIYSSQRENENLTSHPSPHLGELHSFRHRQLPGKEAPLRTASLHTVRIRFCSSGHLKRLGDRRRRSVSVGGGGIIIRGVCAVIHARGRGRMIPRKGCEVLQPAVEDESVAGVARRKRRGGGDQGGGGGNEGHS